VQGITSQFNPSKTTPAFQSQRDGMCEPAIQRMHCDCVGPGRLQLEMGLVWNLGWEPANTDWWDGVARDEPAPPKNPASSTLKMLNKSNPSSIA